MVSFPLLFCAALGFHVFCFTEEVAQVGIKIVLSEKHSKSLLITSIVASALLPSIVQIA